MSADAPPPADCETKALGLMENISDLPSMPTVVAKIQQLLRNPKTSASDLGKLVSSDTAICAKILRVVNSSFYGLENKVTSVDQAIVILGFRALRELIVGVSVLGNFRSEDAHDCFIPEQFLLHSLGVGATCKHLAQRFGFPGEAETYWVCGLLHDTGKMVLFNNLKPTFEKVVAALDLKKVSFCAAELRAYQSHHGYLGAALFEKWGFDADLVLGIRYHHEPSAVPDPETHERAALVASLIHCANVLARLMLLGDMPDRKLAPVDPRAFQRLEQAGLDYEKLPEVMYEIHKEYTASKVFLAL